MIFWNRRMITFHPWNYEKPPMKYAQDLSSFPRMFALPLLSGRSQWFVLFRMSRWRWRDLLRYVSSCLPSQMFGFDHLTGRRLDVPRMQSRIPPEDAVQVHNRPLSFRSISVSRKRVTHRRRWRIIRCRNFTPCSNSRFAEWNLIHK